MHCSEIYVVLGALVSRDIEASKHISDHQWSLSIGQWSIRQYQIWFFIKLRLLIQIVLTLEILYSILYQLLLSRS
jgi:hypothetical protein